MKNIFKSAITAATLSLIGTVALADVTLVNAGSEEGAFRQVLSRIAATEEENTFVQANNPLVASRFFDQQNVLTVWSSEWPSNEAFTSPEVSEDTLVALMTYETLICSREFTSLEEMRGETVKISTWGSTSVAAFLTDLSTETGIDFVVVPYDGSGSTVRGYLGGDADTVFTIVSRQGAIQEDTATSCFAFSANGDIEFQFVDALTTVNATEETVSRLRDTVTELSQTEDWANAFSGTETYVLNDENKDRLMKMYENAVYNFSR